jgi:hypothetical protein
VVVLSAAARPRFSKLLVAGGDRPLLELAHPRYALVERTHGAGQGTPEAFID